MRGRKAALFLPRSRSWRPARDSPPCMRNSPRMRQAQTLRPFSSHPIVVSLALAVLSFGNASVNARNPAELKIATWNLEWFMKPETLRALTPACTPRDAPRDGARRSVPCDVAHELTRSNEDIAALRRYARSLDADVIALQEVDGRGRRQADFHEPRILFLGSSRGAKQWIRDSSRVAVRLRSGADRHFTRGRCAARRRSQALPGHRGRAAAALRAPEVGLFA